MAVRPVLADIRAYLGESSNRFTDEQINAALAAETNVQDAVCRITVYTDALREALCRRVMRNLAMRSLPLAVLQGDIESGSSTYVPTKDPEVRRLEGPYRRLVVG